MMSPHAMCIEKTLLTTLSVSERGDMDSENHSEINSIKTDNNDGYRYIVKGLILTDFAVPVELFYWVVLCKPHPSHPLNAFRSCQCGQLKLDIKIVTFQKILFYIHVSKIVIK